MPDQPEQPQELSDLVAQLTRRVYRLEQAARRAGLELPDEPPVPAAITPVSAPPLAPPNVPQVLASAPAVASKPAASEPTKPLPPRPGLESVIGSQWLNRIGIAAMLIGAAYFLKYAFDNQWIGASGRVAIGLLAGIAVVIWSERFRRRGYRMFSYSLKAVGTGVLYLSLWAAFQLYHLLPSGVAFAAMVLVTASTGFLALQQDAQVLAAFALIGGFSTPLLVSTGENHEIILFSYVTLLDLAALALVALRPWRLLLLGGFAGTLILYIGWYADYYDATQLTPTLVFATIFFAIFAAAALVGSRAETDRAAAREHASSLLLLLPLANTATYFLQVYAALESIHHAWLAWFALALAAVCLALSRATTSSRTQIETRDLSLLHIALATGLITVAIPLKLETHWITIGWLVEAGALLWIGNRSRSSMLRLLAIASLALGAGRLLFFDDFNTRHLLFNARFSAYLVAIAVLAMLVRLGAGLKGDNDDKLRAVAVIAINALALVGLTREVADFFVRAQVGTIGTEWRSLRIARDFSYSALWMVYGAALMFAGFWRRMAFLRWQALILIAITVAKVFLYDVSELERIYRVLSFIVLGVVLLGISFAYQRDWLKLSSASGAVEKS